MLLGPDGLPVKHKRKFAKAQPPKLGESFPSTWMPQDIGFLNLPGGGVIGMDLSRLNLGDFRQMKDHYQINATLSVLTFMLHQMDWKIECDNKKVAAHCTENLEKVWTRLVRAMSQAFWAGYAPNVLQWENDDHSSTVQLTKIKDLVPEMSLVNWKLVDGWAPPGHLKPKIPIYDGIRTIGGLWPVPQENTFWYTLLMQHGDYYGTKLLKPAFTAWYFSILMHLFSNRYFERFGEPLPIGRAPFEETTEIDGQEINSREAMLNILQNLRNRGVVVLPSDRTQVSPNRVEYDFDIQYLESQMRGADFERYMMRLDEEMSLALFTPLLVLRTADVGSYNLGVGHMAVYMNMLNAIAGDWKEYIDRYILCPMKDYNFGVNAPEPKLIFRKLGRDNAETMRAVMSALVSNGTVIPDLDDLGKIVGVDVKKVPQLVADPNAVPGQPGSTPPANGNVPPSKTAPAKTTTTPTKSVPKKKAAASLDQSHQVAFDIVSRVEKQVVNAWKEDKFAVGFVPSLGYRRRFEESLKADGLGDEAFSLSMRLYGRMDRWVEEMVSLGKDEFSTPAAFVGLFTKCLSNEIEMLNA